MGAIYPILTPLAVDPGHPFPMISNLSLNLAVQVRDPATGEERLARVKVPPVLPRFLPIGDGERFVAVDQVIAAHLDTLFPGMVLGEPETFRVTRNADLSLEEEEAEDLLLALEMELRRRRFGRAVRLEAQHKSRPVCASCCCASSTCTRTPRTPSTRRSGSRGCGRSSASTARTCTRRPGRRSPRRASWWRTTRARTSSPCSRERDVLLHHPYDSFSDSVEAFVAQAADDPDVLGDQTHALSDLR